MAPSGGEREDAGPGLLTEVICTNLQISDLRLSSSCSPS